MISPVTFPAFGFIEFTNESHYENDQVNLQYTLFITKTYFKGNKILQTINENHYKNAEGTNNRERFFGMVGAPVTSYNGDKSHFIGSYRSYGNPIAVERGTCDNVLNYNSNGCGALHTKDDLKSRGEQGIRIYSRTERMTSSPRKFLIIMLILSVVDKRT